jgi:NAD(P)-dependent dehydrogenase (short-subunit alcohol dehydrogenase family)
VKEQFEGRRLWEDYDRIFEQFVRTLAWEIAGRGITVNAISPGPTETDMMQDRYRDTAAEKSPRSPSSSRATRRGG